MCNLLTKNKDIVIVNAYRYGGVKFTQLLSSLDLGSYNQPVGMSDSVAANNPVFSKGYAWQGQDGPFLEKTGDNSFLNRISSTNNDFVIEFITRGVFYDSTVSATNVVMSTTWDTTTRNGFRISKITKDNATYPSAISISFFDSIGGRYAFISDTGLFNENKDYHIKITYQSSVLKMFFDNVEVGVTALDGARLTFGSVTNYRPFSLGQATGGILNFLEGDYLYDVKVDDGLDSAYWPLCERIFNKPTDRTHYDVTGNSNHLNGTGNNSNTSLRLRLRGDYSQYGIIRRVSGATEEDIPILDDFTSFADGSLLTDLEARYEPDALINSGATIVQPEVAELITADVDEVYFDNLGNAKEVTFAEIESAISSNPSVYGGEVVSGKTIKNISLK